MKTHKTKNKKAVKTKKLKSSRKIKSSAPPLPPKKKVRLSKKSKKIQNKIVLTSLPDKVEVVKPKSDVEIAMAIIEEKPKSKMYFTKDTEDWIIKYNKEESDDIRNRIFEEYIKYPFDKLVENIFNTFKFSYFETSPLDVQKETVSHLVANMNKFKEGKGKAFSYFSIIAKHYLIYLNNSNYKRFQQNIEVGEDREENTVQLQQDDPHYKDQERKDYMSLMVQFWENNVNRIFTKKRDLDIANAVIELFKNTDRIETFNKKLLYHYIREISGCKTQQITKVINKMRGYHTSITQSYLNTGAINVSNLSSKY